MKIRPAAATDRPVVLQLARRLAEQGTPPNRDRQQVAAADQKSIAAAMDGPSPMAELLVAEADGQVVGFVHVKTVLDYYTQEQIGHVSDLVVASHAEGRGIGRALLEAAQSWAVGRGYSLMQLFVLPENSGARTLYEGTGYRAEWIKYVRALHASGK